MTTVKRSVNDLVKPTIKKDALYEIVQRAGQTKPLYTRADMQEPLYTMILTAFFGLICVVLCLLFTELVAPLVILLWLVCAVFGYEWHTWVMMRRLNRAVNDVAAVGAFDRSMKLLRMSQNAKVKVKRDDPEAVIELRELLDWPFTEDEPNQSVIRRLQQ